MTNLSFCPCNSGESFQNCCEPFLEWRKSPSNPEQLMRSRYTAYSKNDFQYIYDTYTASKQTEFCVEELSRHSVDTKWLNLTIKDIPKFDQVDFIATYQEGKCFYHLHECSTFIKEKGEWRYHDGEIFIDSGEIQPGRNDKCPCGSNKKFKKCCGR